MPTIFITGIDTDVGKTFAAGLLARWLLACGHSVLTQKIVQTGCDGDSEDIRLHRRLMGIDPTDEDWDGLTCPYRFKLPASPHLAAQQEGVSIEPDTMIRATRLLEQRYEYVLLEGAGGVYVPLNDMLTVLDYIEWQQYPVILVSSAKLGSINHTLLTLEALQRRKLQVLGILYNLYPSENPLITEDSQQIFRSFLRCFGYQNIVIPLPEIDLHGEIPMIDFSDLAIMRQQSGPPDVLV